VVVALVAFALLAPVANAAPWQTLTRPWPATVTVTDIAAFPPAGVAAAGSGSRVALSTNGGITWLHRGPALQGSTGAINALDFRDAAHGVVVGARGLILVTSDGGASWRNPGIAGGVPARDLLDVDLAGLNGYAGGAGGTLLSTSDGGETWTRVAPAPVFETITAVAAAGDGSGIAGTDDGQGGGSLLTGAGTTWVLAGPATQPVLDAAAAAQTAWGDAWPDLVVSRGASLLGSTDGAGFGWSLDSPAGPWSALAWAGMPSGDLLLAGPDGAVHSVDDAGSPPSVTLRSSTPIGDAVDAAAPGGQSVAYVLDGGGRIARTLSSARSSGTLGDPPASITAGSSFALDAVVQIAAPGTLVLESRVPGGSWAKRRTAAWTPASWGPWTVTVSPVLNNSYRLRFVYGGRGATITAATSVVKVRPRLTPDRLTYELPRGAVYRFTGVVFPALGGETVDLLTDRGGAWHKIDLGGTVKLSDGGVWRSRRFGTPIRETYRLRAHIKATTRHDDAWSPIVTVTIR
jgi:photosystem II stability/assembly factor-like uncharacterized protein